MANLLPKQTKVAHRYDRWRRIFVTLTIGVVLAVLVSAVAALLPPTLYANIVQQGSGTLSGMAKGAGGKRQVLTKELKASNTLITVLGKALSLPDAHHELSKIIQSITSVPNVSLSSTALKANTTTGTYTIRISGSALRRDDVVSVRQALELVDGVTIVDFPIGNLAPRGGVYNFTLELIL